MKKYIAEFIGTFVLVLFACGVAAVTGCSAAADASYILTALAFGGVIVAMAYSIGNVSGCHINPAVSIAVWINKGMSGKDFVCYLIAQFLGAIAGAAVLMALIGTDMGLGANGLYDGSIGKSLLV
ncbi:MAG: aquaporin, partial [Christensenellaceae bacterium]|nr:aquaporin [Christensenellaceae bacterium]